MPAWLTALIALPVLAACVAWLVPGVAVRLFTRFSVYRADRLPKSGPALVVANHVGCFDWLYLMAAIPRRLRFVRTEGFGPFAQLMTRRATLPGGEAGDGEAAQALGRGEVVVLFGEEGLTRTGAMRPFTAAVERVQELCTVPVPIIPAFLDNVWGTLGSYSDGRLWWKRLEEPFTRRRLAVAFGEPLPAGRSAAEVRAAVAETGADCAFSESRKILPVARLFVRQAASWRQLFRRAVVDSSTGSERTLTWSRTLVGAWALSGWLKSRVGTGQNVAVWHPTTLGTALANLALGFLNRTAVNLNYTAGPEVVASAIRQAGVTTIISSRRFRAKVPLNVPEGVTVVDLEDAMAGISPWGNLLRYIAVILLPGWFLDRVVLRLGRIDPESPATILFSSGSTGEPKGVVLSHRNVSANVDGFRRGVHFTTADRMLITLPLFHSFGYTVSFCGTMAVGMEAVFHADPRQAQEIGELCRRHGCTCLLGTATFLRLYLRRCAPDALKTLRLLVCGAEKLPVALQDEFAAKFGVRPLEGYGCTELSPVVSVNLPDADIAGTMQVANRPGTVGQPIPTVAARAFDFDTFEPLPPGAVGNLAVRGPNLMSGYLGRPDLTAAAVRGGWYLTGDVGAVEPDGFVRITGRLSRFAKIAGEMVPLERLDDEMHELLGSPPERVLAVAAVPCDKRGERVVVLHLAAANLDLIPVFEGLRGRGLPNLWIPDKRDCYAVEAIPLLGTGKLDLRGVGELARDVASS